MFQRLRGAPSPLVGSSAAEPPLPRPRSAHIPGWLGTFIRLMGLSVLLAVAAGTAQAEPTPAEPLQAEPTQAELGPLKPPPPASGDGALPELPASLPPGYAMEAKGPVRWIYPESASDTVADLQEAAPEDWKELSGTFGQPLAPALDIRVAIDPSDMRRLVNGRALPDYASGVAFPEEGLILLSLTAPESWHRPDMAALLTHELSHVALARAVANQPVPRWFTEGVAIHQAGERSIARIRTLWAGTLGQRLMPVEALSRAFPRRHHEVDLAYAQSADLVRYMLDGSDDQRRFRSLIAGLRRGETFEQAVQSAYHVSLGYIEREWRNQVTRRFGRWPSVLAGLTGVWAFGAVLLLVGYIRTRRRHHRTLAQWEADEAQNDAAAVAFRAATEKVAVTEVAEGNRPHRVDEVFDRLQDRRREPSGVPTIEHEGRSYTLH